MKTDREEYKKLMTLRKQKTAKKLSEKYNLSSGLKKIRSFQIEIDDKDIENIIFNLIKHQEKIPIGIDVEKSIDEEIKTIYFRHAIRSTKEKKGMINSLIGLLLVIGIGFLVIILTDLNWLWIILFIVCGVMFGILIQSLTKNKQKSDDNYRMIERGQSFKIYLRAVLKVIQKYLRGCQYEDLNTRRQLIEKLVATFRVVIAHETTDDYFGYYNEELNILGDILAEKENFKAISLSWYLFNRILEDEILVTTFSPELIEIFEDIYLPFHNFYLTCNHQVIPNEKYKIVCNQIEEFMNYDGISEYIAQFNFISITKAENIENRITVKKGHIEMDKLKGTFSSYEFIKSETHQVSYDYEEDVNKYKNTERTRILANKPFAFSEKPNISSRVPFFTETCADLKLEKEIEVGEVNEPSLEEIKDEEEEIKDEEEENTKSNEFEKYLTPKELEEIDHYMEVHKDYGEGWKKKVDSKGIKVYKKEVEGSPVLLIKASTVFEGISPDEVFAFLTHIETRKIHENVLSKIRVVEKKNKRLDYIYSFFKAPIGMSNRDFFVKRILLKGYKGSSYLAYNTTAKRDDCPEEKGTIRCNTIMQGFIAWPVENDPNSCRITFVSQNDLKGYVPKWIFNTFAPRKTKSVLVNIQKTLRKLLKEDYMEKHGILTITNSLVNLKPLACSASVKIQEE